MDQTKSIQDNMELLKKHADNNWDIVDLDKRYLSSCSQRTAKLYGSECSEAPSQRPEAPDTSNIPVDQEVTSSNEEPRETNTEL